MTSTDSINDPVTNELVYNGRTIKFSLHTDDGGKKGVHLWYIQADVEGVQKPLKSLYLQSLFVREVMEESKKLTDAQDYLNSLFTGINVYKDSKCEILTVNLDYIELMWYAQGRVAIEKDESLMTITKMTIDLLDKDKPKLIRL